MSNQEEIKQKYLEFQQLQQHIEQVTEHVQKLQEQVMEAEISKNALGVLRETKKDTEILAPIANGIFIKASLQNNSELIVNVGSNTTVEKTIPEVVKMIEKQQQKMHLSVKQGENALEQLQKQAMEIYQEVESKSEE